MERVILTTGGTGGHVFPALAVAEELRARHPGVRILFVGGKRGPEAEVAAKHGLEFVALPVQPVLGRGAATAYSMLCLGVGTVRAMGLVRRFNPQVVLGLGGYAAFSMVLAARLSGRPTAIHEQNSIPGLANRLLGRFVKRVFVSFSDSASWFHPSKVELTGNPVRAEIRQLGAINAGRRTAGYKGNGAGCLLVLGGSQGAMAINTAVLESLPQLIQAGVSIRHQAGQYDLDRTRAGYRGHGLDPDLVQAFIVNMAEAYAQADLVLCRAGATTVAEIAVAGKPCVFIPYPYATHNHQVVNARSMEKAGAGICIEQSQLREMNLAETIIGLLADPVRLNTMARAARRLGQPEAAKAVVTGLEHLADNDASCAARNRVKA